MGILSSGHPAVHNRGNPVSENQIPAAHPPKPPPGPLGLTDADAGPALVTAPLDQPGEDYLDALDNLRRSPEEMRRTDMQFVALAILAAALLLIALLAFGRFL